MTAAPPRPSPRPRPAVGHPPRQSPGSVQPDPHAPRDARPWSMPTWPGARRLSSYLGDTDPRPMVAIFGLNSVDRLDSQTFFWLAPVIARSFHLKASDFGGITIAATLLGPLLALALARVADRRSRMAVATLGGVLWGSFSLLTGLSVSIVMLVVARIGSESGRTVNLPVHSSLLGDFYPPRVLARAFGLHELADAVGATFGTLAGTGLAALFDWRVPFFVLTVPTVLVLLYARRVPEPERGVYERVLNDASPGLRDTFRQLLAIRTLRSLYLGYVWIAAGLGGAALLLPFLLKDSFHIGDVGYAVVASVGTGMSAVTVVVGSRLGQQRLNTSAQQGLRFVVGGAAGVGVTIALVGAAHYLVLVVPLFVLAYAGIGLVEPLSAATVALVVPPELRSSAFALRGVFALVAVVPVALLLAVDNLEGHPTAIFLCGPVFLYGLTHYWRATTTIEADVARLASVGVDSVGGVSVSGVADDVVLRTSGLTVHYDGVQVLFGVDLEIRRGEVVALLGTNGAGKSTVLNAICGLVPASGGNVWLAGQAVTGTSAERMAAAGVVQAPGGRGIFPSLTVQENLRLGAFLIRKDKALARVRLAEVLEVFPGLVPVLSARAGSLSGGQRQQLVLAQAFLVRPTVLLIDELSLGLAPVVVAELLKQVRALNEVGVTIVVVEQSVNLALTLASRAYFLEKGQVRFSGPTGELLERPDLLRSVFLGGAVRAPEAVGP